MTGNSKKILIVLAIGVIVSLFFSFDLQDYLTLADLKARHAAVQQFYAANTGLTLRVYLVFYVIVIALSLPGATVMTLAGGALFSFLPTVIVVSFASTLGSTLAFLVSQ